MNRGEIWCADLPVPVRSEPGYRRPFLVVQGDDFNRSGLGGMPGNVLHSTRESGLPKIR